MIEQGLIQVFTGDGKGKTTAAIGAGIRAVGHGNIVYMIQFLKGQPSGELNTLKLLEPNLKVFRFEKERDFFWNLNDKEKDELKIEINEAFSFAKKAIDDKACDMLILDEIMSTIENRLLNIEDIIEFILNKPTDMELVLTGRNVPGEIMNIAHYVSNIECVKHPFDLGINARLGIEY